MRRIDVERFSVTSRKSFRDVIAALQTTVGHPDMDVFRKSVSQTKTVAEMAKAIGSAVGPSGFMELIRFDHGELLLKQP